MKKNNRTETPCWLLVSFGDNDFGGIVETALRRIWEWVNTNNGHLVEVVPRTVPRMFRELHKAGALLSMIERMCDIEYMASDVEYKTRGLYWKDVVWADKKITAPFAAFEYLSFDIKFHRTKTFAKKWQNGECAFLDLATGEAGTF